MKEYTEYNVDRSLVIIGNSLSNQNLPGQCQYSLSHLYNAELVDCQQLNQKYYLQYISFNRTRFYISLFGTFNSRIKKLDLKLKIYDRLDDTSTIVIFTHVANAPDPGV